MLKARMNDFLGTDEHGFNKDTAGHPRWEWLYLLRAILKYRHGSLTLVFIDHRLAQIGTD